MSWDISLINGNSIVQVPKHYEGGVILIGGRTDASMSVTWNYSKFYYEHFDKEEGIRWIHNKKAKETVDRLIQTINILGIKQSSNYWDSTPGNAGHILNVMLKWAKLHPEAKWKIY